MSTACGICGGSASLVRESQDMQVRGRVYTVPDVEMWRCADCGEDVLTGEQSRALDQQLLALRRKAEHLLPPETIKALRERLGLTQQQLCDLLDVGDKTVARWECGMTLQSKTADDVLRMLLANPGSVYALSEERLGIRRPTYDPARAAQAILFFLRNTTNTGMTKLMKLLYFADFETFRRFGHPLTGATYEAMQYGPLPKEIYEDLTSEEPGVLPVDVEIVTRPEGGRSYRLSPRAEANLSIFEPGEHWILEATAEKWRDLPREALVEAAHQDPAWKNTPSGSIITYPIFTRRELAPA